MRRRFVCHMVQLNMHSVLVVRKLLMEERKSKKSLGIENWIMEREFPSHIAMNAVALVVKQESRVR